MLTAKKISETGWFYHAPVKAAPKDGPQPVPPASQIPGLSELPPEPYEEPKKCVIMESDSPYVRLAKTGGRPDLLRMRTPNPKADEPKPYPRNDWFYTEDIALEESCKPEAENNSDYVFTLPDYMVHREPKGKTNGNNSSSFTPNRLPYAYDKSTVYQREGGDVCNKTVAIEEDRPHGFGIRAEKNKGKPVKVKQPMSPQERAKAPESQLDSGAPKVKPMRQLPEEERPPMSKILSYGYAKDWVEERDKWEASQKKAEDRNIVSENKYQSSMASGTTPVRTGSHHSRVSSTGSRKSGVKKTKSTESEKKELFKLSKFKNVPAKTNTNRAYGNDCPFARD